MRILNARFSGEPGTLCERGRRSRWIKAFFVLATIPPVAFLGGCTGFAGGQNTSPPPPPPQTYDISGSISPTAGGNGATVTLGGAKTATTTANSSGAYSFTGLTNGTYTVTPSDAGYTYNPSTQSVTVSGAGVTGVNFTATPQGGQTFTISGTISPTAGGSGATVTLNGAANATTTANASGVYTFTGLVNGSYTVTPTNTGYTFAPASQSVTISGANVTGLNFTASIAQTYSISGTISPTAGGSGATLSLSGTATATTTADSSGNYTFSGLVNGTYTIAPYHTGYTFSPVSQTATVTGANVTGVNFTATVQTSSGKWVTGYYANWQLTQYPVNRIDLTALTHIVLAHWLTNSNGTVGSSGWDASCAPLVTAAHAAGVKVLMMLGGSDDVNYPTASNATNLATLLTSIHSKITNCNLDGVDLDWENGIILSQWVNIASGLKANYPGIIVTVPMDPGDPASYPVSMYPYVDQLNMMTYGGGTAQGGGCVSWYFSPLQGDTSNTCQPSVEKAFTVWTGAGVPASKLGAGIGFYSVGWTAPVTGALQATTGSSIPIGEMPYGSSEANGGLLGCYYKQSSSGGLPSGVNYQYDPSPAVSTNASSPPQQPSLSIPAGLTDTNCSSQAITWITYEDEASIAAKAAFVKANNMGGAIIWTLSDGASDPNTGRNPLLDAVKLGFLNNGPAPMPQLATQEASVGGATTIPLTGLPSNLGQINASWWNGTSGVAWDDATDTGFATYGQPSEYYIEASPDGTTWTQLSHITGEHYTGRQFVYDFTGKGYTQIRMRIISIVGSNAGYDTFTVNNAANNSADAYLFLGDSITANCLTSTSNTFPIEQFGAQIHAARPNRYPVNTVGGQSGFLSATPLSTAAYGIPAIRQWLNDMPAVKFVTLNFGTNDANGNIPTATYIANMKALVQEVIAAGKRPIIPTIVASPSAAVQANAPAMNAALATLEQNYPAIIPGPDLWKLFQGHSVSDGWFLDSLHPSLTTGCTAWQNAWVTTMLSAEYPQ
jgi:GH18 family chitinase